MNQLLNGVTAVVRIWTAVHHLVIPDIQYPLPTGHAVSKCLQAKTLNEQLTDPYPLCPVLIELLTCCQGADWGLSEPAAPLLLDLKRERGDEYTMNIFQLETKVKNKESHATETFFIQVAHTHSSNHCRM